MITSSIEHQAVLNSCRELEKKGYEVTYVPVDRNGRIDVADVKNAIREDTVMISIMYGNNETGTVQPIEEIGRLSREKGVLFHVDAVQALGVVPLRLRDLPVDLVSFSAHKINGPKGAGILYVSSGTRIRPLLFGGAQESGQRAGTENPAGIVGMVKAVERAVFNMNEKRKHFDQLVEEMSSVLNEQLGDQRWVINGHPRERLPHICNISFPGVETETLLMNLDLEGVAASSGSACSSGSLQVSHVLKAMDLPGEIIRSAVRFSFGPDTTAEEVREAAKKTATIVRRLS